MMRYEDLKSFQIGQLTNCLRWTLKTLDLIEGGLTPDQSVIQMLIDMERDNIKNVLEGGDDV